MSKSSSTGIYDYRFVSFLSGLNELTYDTGLILSGTKLKGEDPNRRYPDLILTDPKKQVRMFFKYNPKSGKYE